MHRRTLLISAAMGPIAPVAASAQSAARSVALGGMDFLWSHADGRLHGRLNAPGTGWLAVGFNAERTLRGTRFVIAAVATPPPRAEVHIAQPPEHRSVEDLTGQPSGLGDVAGGYADGRSTLSFSLPHQSGDRFGHDLSPGRTIHLMLAWSHEPDFDHHSAWRGHTDVTL